jgi:hypothetical protein
MNFIRFTLVLVVTFFCVMLSYSQMQNIPVATDNNADESETAIAVHPTNPNILMGCWNYYNFVEASTYTPGYGFSFDGGKTWSVSKLDTPYIPRPFGAHPSCAINRNGVAYYCFEATNSKNERGTVILARKNVFDPLEEWQSPVAYPDTFNVINDDKPYMTIDNSGGARDGWIYISWTKNLIVTEDYQSWFKSYIMFASSADGGISFSTPQKLDSAKYIIQNYSQFNCQLPLRMMSTAPRQDRVIYSMTAIGPSGEVYVTWLRYTEDTLHFIKLGKSTDGGQTFGLIQTVAKCRMVWVYGLTGGIFITNLPSIAIDQNNGYVHVVYIDRTSEDSSDPHVKHTRSVDGGTSWSTPKRIDMPPLWSAFPSVAVDKKGNVAVSYMYVDFEWPVYMSVNCYMTASTDRGTTFQKPQKVTTVSSDAYYASLYHLYMGIASSGSKILNLWTDYRNENSDVYFSPITILETTVNAKWNMASVPAMVSDFAKAAVWPNSISDALWYKPGTGYLIRNTLENRLGYWIEFSSAQTITYIGNPIDSLHIDVQAGWNMIGSMSQSLSTSKVKSVPPGIIIPNYWKYYGGSLLSRTNVE